MKSQPNLSQPPLRLRRMRIEPDCLPASRGAFAHSGKPVARHCLHISLGAVVLFAAPDQVGREFVRSLDRGIIGPVDTRATEFETASLAVRSDANEQVDPHGGIVLRDLTPAHLLPVATVMDVAWCLAATVGIRIRPALRGNQHYEAFGIAGVLDG